LLLVVYGGPNEVYELAAYKMSGATTVEAGGMGNMGIGGVNLKGGDIMNKIRQLN
jgi:hypothetical protein